MSVFQAKGDFQPSVLIGAKRVKQEKDKSERDRIVLTLDVEQTKLLAAALGELAAAGKQTNIDTRIGEAESENGRKFPTAFSIVKEMIPKSAGGGATTFKPKNTRAQNVKADADRIRAEVEG